MHLFSGRINRRNFSLGFFGALVFIYVFFLFPPMINAEVSLTDYLAQLLFHQIALKASFWIILSLAVLHLLLYILFTYSLTIRRLHDVGLSGWFVLPAVFPAFTLLLMLVLLFIPGQKQWNQYGGQPVSRLDLSNIFGLDRKAP
jgi:uncharacterized membrane protein YhaH (DUF805 family)